MYGCPNCGGGLRFDIKSQELKCDYCSSQFNPYSISKEKDAQTDTEFGVTVFKCPQCGGEVITTDESITGFCSFCGASTILDARMETTQRPKKIITFKKTKEDCKEIYRRMAGRAIFAPKELKDPKYLDKFRGIYIPYWVYDISYKDKVELDATTSERTGDAVITNFYDISFDLDAEYTGVSYDASASFDDHISETIAPFHAEHMQDFTPSFLSGFYADTSDVDKELYREDAIEAARRGIANGINEVPELAGYTYGDLNASAANREATANSTGEPDLALFPVWFLSYKTKNNRVAYAVVNAENGEISADLPVDVKKYVIGSLILAAPIFLLLNFLFTLTPKVDLVISIIFSLITVFVYKGEMSEIEKRHARYDDRGFYSKYGQEFEAAEMKKIKSGPGIIGSIIAIIISVAVLIINPANDFYYYIAAIISILGIILTVSAIIRRFNILTTRPFPSFLGRKGGNDSAKD